MIFPSPGRRLPLLRGKDDATHPKRPGCHYYLSGSYHKYGNIIVRDSRCRGIAWGFLGLGGPIPGPLARGGVPSATLATLRPLAPGSARHDFWLAPQAALSTPPHRLGSSGRRHPRNGARHGAEQPRKGAPSGAFREGGQAQTCGCIASRATKRGAPSEDAERYTPESPLAPGRGIPQGIGPRGDRIYETQHLVYWGVKFACRVTPAWGRTDSATKCFVW